MPRVTPELLLNTCAPALAVAGLPPFPSPDDSGEIEALRYLPPADGPPGGWALVPMQPESDAPAAVVALPDEIDPENALPVDVRLAAELVRGHLRGWLAARGWQVQMTMARERVTWRLVDCLAFTEGGGDRLDDHYPSGEDELVVLCESVVTLARHGMT